jgi:hypothetical protein
MALFRKKVEETGLIGLAQKELEIFQQLKAKQLAITQLEQAIGERFLDGTPDAAATTEAARIRVELAGLENATLSLRAMRAGVLERHCQRRGDELRKQASALQKEIDAIAAKSAELLAQLGALEHCQMVSVPGASDTGLPSTPRSVLLMRQILNLQDQAMDIESKAESNSGAVDLEEATTNDAAVLAVLQHASIGPSAAEVMAWLESCEDLARGRFHIAGFGEMPRRVQIYWSNSKIDPNSTIFCAALAPKVMSQSAAHDGGSSHFDVDRGTFRPANASA